MVRSRSVSESRSRKRSSGSEERKPNRSRGREDRPRDSSPRRGGDSRRRQSPPRKGRGGYSDRSGKGKGYDRYDRGGYGGNDDRGYGGKGGKSKSTGCSLIVRNLSQNTTDRDLKDLFSRVAELRDVYVPKDHFSGLAKGFGFIEFLSHRDAMSAMREFDGERLHGQEISVQEAKHGRRTPDAMAYRDEPKGRGRGDSRRRR